MIRPFIALPLLVLSLSGCDLLIDGLIQGSIGEAQRPNICTSGQVPPTPDGATAEEVEAEVAALCRR